MDISHFDEFLELSKRLNFTEAARHLNMTQSALSKHISALERKFDASLFRRNRQRVELTEAGRVLYERAVVISENYHDAFEEVKEVKTRPPIRVAGIIQNHEIIELLSKALAIASKDEANQESITPIIVEQFMPLLISGEVDLCICTKCTDINEEPEFGFEPLYNDRFIVMVEKEHHLAGRKSLSLKECADETFLQLISDYSEPAWKCIEYACSRAGFNPKKRTRLIKSTLEYATIPLGDTIYVVPETTLATSPLRYNKSLTTIAVVDDFAVFPLGVAYMKERQAELADFIDLLHEASRYMINRVDSDKPRPAHFRIRCEQVAAAHGLSDLEQEILKLHAKGHLEERIASETGLSISDVQNALSIIFSKTGAANKQALIDLIDSWGQ